MRIECPHCTHRAVIKSSNALSHTVKDIYCVCTNVPDCGASFVFTLAYKHDLNPPIKSTQQLALQLIRGMADNDRKTLMQHEIFSLDEKA